ncbi:hypothetical protein TNCV_1948261 [Trichonephila clavipes]|nr:hypothetical protein TNCV_1948261 [Trichonephila clavipes]
MPRVRSRNVYQHVFDFDKGQTVANQNCGLSYRSITAHVDRDPKTVSRIWNRWVEDGKMELHAGSNRAPNHQQPRRQACYLNGLGSCSHVTSPESRTGVVCNTKRVCTNSSTTFSAAWNGCRYPSTLQTGVSSMV